jgi:hypothetical protein
MTPNSTLPVVKEFQIANANLKPAPNAGFMEAFVGLKLSPAAMERGFTTARFAPGVHGGQGMSFDAS